MPALKARSSSRQQAQSVSQSNMVKCATALATSKFKFSFMRSCTQVQPPLVTILTSSSSVYLSVRCVMNINRLVPVKQAYLPLPALVYKKSSNSMLVAFYIV